MPLSIQHQADSAGDKAVSLIADNSGSNVAAAFKGVNKATQNGDTVADLVVSLDGEAIATGATDDAAAAGAIFPLAGIYQSTVDQVDAGDVGRVRMSARRAVVTAQDWSALVLTSGVPNPTGNDVTVYNGGSAVPVSGDLAIRDTNTRQFMIPLTVSGFRRCGIEIFSSSAFDQTATIEVGTAHAADAWLSIPFATWTHPASSIYYAVNGGGIGQGATAGGATAATKVVYVVPMLSDGAVPFVRLAITMAGVPTTGVFIMRVWRG